MIQAAHRRTRLLNAKASVAETAAITIARAAMATVV